jgi:hypothetical protein
MQLENLLSEIKASVPKGKQTAYGEKTAYLSHLSQLMKQHLHRGRRDLRGCLRQDELLAMGVPLDRRTQSGVKRPDTAWRNRQLHEWKLQHPGATSEEEARHVRLFGEMFAAFSDEERAAAIGSLPEIVTDVAEQDYSPQSDVIDRAFDIDIFDLGNDEWPMRDEILASFVHGHSGHDAAGIAGIANKAASIRREESGALIILDRGSRGNSTSGRFASGMFVSLCSVVQHFVCGNT